jgi:hypothetical protein
MEPTGRFTFKMYSDVRDGFFGSVTNIEILVYIELLLASLIEYNIQEMMKTMYSSAVIYSLCRDMFLSVVVNRTTAVLISL